MEFLYLLLFVGIFLVNSELMLAITFFVGGYFLGIVYIALGAVALIAWISPSLKKNIRFFLYVGLTGKEPKLEGSDDSARMG